jgi:hypothetical protein
MPACGSPKLIAACHVLLRLLLPRHPPCALSSLTIKFTQGIRRLHCRLSAISFQPSAFAADTPRNFMVLMLCSSPPKCGIAAAETPAESKALIKITLSTRLVVIYPMLFSCQKSSASKDVPPGWAGPHVLPKVRRQATCAIEPIQKFTVVATDAQLKAATYN